MVRLRDGRVQVSITLDRAVVRRLQEEAANRSVPLADFIEEIVHSAALEAGGARAPGSLGEQEPNSPPKGNAGEERLPQSVGLADVDFDARDTDAWIAAHWARE